MNEIRQCARCFKPLPPDAHGNQKLCVQCAYANQILASRRYYRQHAGVLRTQRRRKYAKQTADA